MMIKEAKNWTIDSEWTLKSEHFRYYFMLSKDFDIGIGKNKIKNQFTNYIYEMFGDPGSHWGFRFDRNFDTINLYFSNQEDAVIFRLTHG